MGATRKSLSILTFGLIDFWSDKERIARNTKRVGREAATQTKIMREMRRDARRS